MDAALTTGPAGATLTLPRLTTMARGGGCACKVPAGELDALVAALPAPVAPVGARVVVGVGDDAAVLALRDDLAVVTTTDFFTPVVDDPYDWGRIAAANAMSDVWAVGGEPVAAVNLLVWPRESLPHEVVQEVLRGGADMVGQAGALVAGGHSIDGPEPVYGLAVTGTAHPDRLLRMDSGSPGIPLSLTKPLGIGVANAWHKRTGEPVPEAVDVMTTLNREASRAALAAGAVCATDVTGFGLLGHLLRLVRASGVAARVEASAVPVLERARGWAAEGVVPGGSRRNLEHVAPHTRFADDVDEVTRLLLADAQTSGGLLVAGEVPGAPVVGELVAARSGGPLLDVV